MSDTDLLNIGKYVTDNMPALTEVIKESSKPGIGQILNAIAEILTLNISDIKSANKENAFVDSRIIFSIITLSIHDPERLKNNGKKSKVIPKIATLINRDKNAVYHYICQHNILMKCNSAYRTKFNYVSKAILK
jgi:hypothetical protein